MVGRFLPGDRYVQYETAGWTPRNIQSVDIDGFARLRTNNSSYSLNEEPLLVSADGACNHNGQEYAVAAYGVFVGHDGIAASWNECARLRSKATSQRAELVAAIRAVTIGMKLSRQLSPHEVIVKMDSMYVVKGITEWVFKWKRNGWKTCRGGPVANRNLWRALDLRVRQLESKHQLLVQFWHVPRWANEDADQEANRALD